MTEPLANSLEFIRATPSSKFFTLLTVSTGPKTSRLPMVMPGFTWSKSVGPR
jgi:hypothetical protein